MVAALARRFGDLGLAEDQAVALAELDGPEAALTQIERVSETLDNCHAFHAARADLLRRIGRNVEARSAYDKAIHLAGNTAEQAYLTRRRDQLLH